MSALEEWWETVKLRNFGPCHKILEDPHIKTYLTELQHHFCLQVLLHPYSNGRAWHKFRYKS